MMYKKGKKYFLNRLFLILAIIAILMIIAFLYGFHRYEEMVPGTYILSRNTGFLLLFIALYILSVQSGRVLLSWLTLLPALILILEIVCSLLLGLPQYPKRNFNMPDFPEDHIKRKIGKVPPADRSFNSVEILGADTVCNAFYSTDAWHKRITPGYDSTRSQYALFFGCSITYGLHVSDDETMPFRFQEAAKDFNAYNYGVTGRGPNHMLARLQYKSLREQVREDSGCAFYVFFSDHINRSVGSMNRYTEWLVYEPYYYLDRDSLKRNRLFVDGRLLISKFYESVYRLNIIKYFQIDFPLRIRKRHIKLIAEVIHEAKLEYQRQFGNDNFFVVLYPERPDADMKSVKRLCSMLEQKGIAIIDISEGGFHHEMSLGWNGHPGPATHRDMAERLLKKYRLIQH